MGDEGTWTYMMRSIPIGIYTATAKIITPEGTVVPVRCKVREEGKDIDKTPWAASARINFPNTPNEFGASVTLYLAKP